MAGVVAGMEALKLIADSGAAHRRNLACVAYAAEEPGPLWNRLHRQPARWQVLYPFKT